MYLSANSTAQQDVGLCSYRIPKEIEIQSDLTLSEIDLLLTENRTDLP